MSVESVDSSSSSRVTATLALHHPSSEMLAGYALGDCSPGAALLVSRHVALCARCAAKVQPMGSPPPASWTAPADAAWRNLCPGFEISPLMEARGLGEVAFQIRAVAGARLPGVIAARIDELLVLAGGFRFAGQSAGVGDFYLPSLEPHGELVASAHEGLYGLFTAPDEAWGDED